MKAGFSTLELLFVIVILGIISSFAIPKISFTRTNALAVAIQSDIATISSSVQEFALTNNFTSREAKVSWLISYLNLSPQRWAISSDELHIANKGVIDPLDDCITISFTGTRTLDIQFNRAITSNLCSAIMRNYSQDITINLDVGL